MEDSYKQYHGSIFSHKRGTWAGMDQGKGDLYRGDTVGFMLNVNTKDNVFTARIGQEFKRGGSEGVQAGRRTLGGVSIVSGVNLFFDAVFPAITTSDQAFYEPIIVTAVVSGEFTRAIDDGTMEIITTAVVSGDHGPKELEIVVSAVVSGAFN